ncbi:MAG: transcriptional regulator [Bdellovibrio sp.]|nr:MAG: transcriptional regulator [Bdellovibrio sp.]
MKPLAAHIRSPSQLVNALKRYRKQSFLTQAELGESAGLPQTTVSKIEVEMIDPSLSTLFKVLAALDLEIEIKDRKSSVRAVTGK